MGGILFLSELERKGVAISWETLLENPSINAIIQLGQADKKEPLGYPPRESYPLTNMQIWFAHILRGSTTANLPFLIKLKSTVDLLKLKAAISHAFDCHPALKGRIYQNRDGVFRFWRHNNQTIEIPVIDISADDWVREQKSLVRAYRYMPDEPLYHACIYRTPDANYLFLDVAHIVSDGMSMTILFNDIKKLYAGFQVPQERYTYFDFVLDEQKRNAEGLRGRDIAYFTEQMSGLKIRSNILTRPDFHNLETVEFAVLRGVLPRLKRETIASFCKETGVSANILFNAAFNYTVSLFRNEHDSASCTIHSGRTDGRWQHLVGPLFMSCYFRFKENPDESVSQTLRRLASANRQTVTCFVSNLKCDEMFFQYQGDFLKMNAHADLWEQSVELQLESQPFHLQIMATEHGFAFEQRYWANRFGVDQLRVFLRVLESVVVGFTTEATLDDVRLQIPQSVLPMNPLYNGQPAKVLNDSGLEQPVGGWGAFASLGKRYLAQDRNHRSCFA